MLIHQDKKFVSQPFDSEDELESLVLGLFEYIFGPTAIFLPKKQDRDIGGAIWSHIDFRDG